MFKTLARLLALVVLIPSAVAAQETCSGRDLRQTLSPGEQEMLNVAVAATPFAEGNHWKATRGATEIHLVGTMHLGDPRLDGPTARLAPLIARAGLLMLEATPREEEQLQEALTRRPELLILKDTTLPELMDEESWQELAAAASARGIPPFMAAKFQPWYLSVMLAIPPCAMAQIAERNGLDARLSDMAEAAGVPMQALEPYDTVFRAFAEAPIETQIEMMKTGLSDTGLSEDQFATLLAGYFDEEHAASWVLTRILSYRLDAMDPEGVDAAFDEIEQKLLVERNRSWVPNILAAVDKSPVVVAVGAAHFHGENGVLRLLEREGFTLERLEF